MIELTVKTLDSKNHTFSVPDDITVKQLKEQIADSVNISAESQRLIYCGRVLQDDKNLSEYDVNGKVIHLVQRAPPVSNGSGPDRGPTTARSATGSSANRRTQQWRTLFGPGGNSGNAMYVGAMAFPAEIMEASGISMQQPRQCLSQSRLTVARNMLSRAAVALNRLENPPQESSDASPENGNGSSDVNAEEETATTSVPIAAVEITPESFVIDNQTVHVGGPSVEVQTEVPTEQNNTANDNDQAQPASASDQQPAQSENEDAANSNSRSPRTGSLASLMDQAADINTRVQPFMAQYQQLMREDPAYSNQVAVATNQRLFNGVSEIMHNLAHAYHALSDIMCDFSQPPPRLLRCRPVLIHHSAVVQTDIPIQVSASLAAANSNQQSANNGNSRANENGSRPSSTASASPDESADQSAPSVAQPGNEEQPAPQPSATTTNTNSNPPPPTTAPATDPEQAHRSPFASPLRITRIGPGGPGLEFFVDVAPTGSIMIDSVEAHVVTNAPPNTAEANTAQNPPEFVQNLITALAGQFMGATLQQYQAHAQQMAGGSGTSTQQQPGSTQQQPSGTQQQQPSSTQQQPSGTQQQQPSSTQQQQASSTQQQQSSSTQQQANSTQQQTGSAQQPATAQNSQARGNTATHPTTATQTRSTARPHVHLSPSIHGLRANSFDPFLPCNSHHIRINRGNRSRAGQPVDNGSGATNESAGSTISFPRRGTNSISISYRSGNGSGTTNETTRVPIGPGNRISINLRPDPVVTAEQNAPRSSGTGTAPPRRNVVTPVPPEVQALYHAMRNPTTPATLAQLLQNVPGYSYVPGRSIFTDVFMTLSQTLSFMDMVQLGMGDSECLVRVRPQLRQLISQQLLNNEPFTISAITQIIDRLNNELRPYYSVLENGRFREDIDLPASLSLYNHSMLPSIMSTVMEEDQTTFHRTLMNKCALYVHQLCALLMYCCLDGASGLENILRTFVNQMTTGVPGFLQDWTVSHSVVNFRSFVDSVNVPTEDIKRFLVYRVNNPDASPQPATTPPLVPPAAEPMDVQEMEEASAVVESTPSHVREPPIADVPPTQHINEVVGWQNTLPSDWVPIITRDSQRQRRQSPQGPFSDAYLSGMPSKRRKLITSTKPQGNLSQVISESMASALGAAGMSAGPEVDVIAQRAGQDRTLRTAYREQVRTTLRHNLSSNSDYTPEKYPNSAKYFNQK